MRLLYLTHRVPYAPNRGDRIRAYETLRHLKARGIRVCLVALAHDEEEAAEAGRIADLVDALHVVRVTRARNLLKAGMQLASDRPLTHVFRSTLIPRQGGTDIRRTYYTPKGAPRVMDAWHKLPNIDRAEYIVHVDDITTEYQKPITPKI